jgi:hypothetical protein
MRYAIVDRIAIVQRIFPFQILNRLVSAATQGWRLQTYLWYSRCHHGHPRRTVQMRRLLSAEAAPTTASGREDKHLCKPDP